MTLHTKVAGEDFGREVLSVNPRFAGAGDATAVPKHRMPDGQMMAAMA
jgi:hypothetical protein